MCQHKQVELGKTIMSSGKYHVWYRCRICEKNVTLPGPYISKKSLVLANLNFDNLPTFIDYRLNNPPCAVCGAVGTELHHFAPKELFPDTFNEWPTAYLCDPHHREWHNKITIPLRTLRNKERKTNDGQPATPTCSTVPQ